MQNYDTLVALLDYLQLLKHVSEVEIKQEVLLEIKQEVLLEVREHNNSEVSQDRIE